MAPRLRCELAAARLLPPPPPPAFGAAGALDGLPYADAVIAEALRTCCPLMGNSRLVVAPCTVGGWALPAGTRLTVNYAAACFDAAAWRDPFAFVPERHLGGEAAAGAGAPAAPAAATVAGGRARTCPVAHGDGAPDGGGGPGAAAPAAACPPHHDGATRGGGAAARVPPHRGCAFGMPARACVAATLAPLFAKVYLVVLLGRYTPRLTTVPRMSNALPFYRPRFRLWLASAAAARRGPVKRRAA